MIDMFLNMGQPTLPTDAPLFETWHEQTEIELTLLSIVGICIPAMLLVKPIILALVSGKKKSHDSHDEKENHDDNFKAIDTPKGNHHHHHQHEAPVSLAEKYDIRDNIVKSAGDQHHHAHDFGELMIH